MSSYELKIMSGMPCLIVKHFSRQAKDWFAEITGFDEKYTYKRQFLRSWPYSDKDKGVVFRLEKDKLYQYNFKGGKGFLVLRASGKLEEPELEAVYTILHTAEQTGVMSVEDYYNPRTQQTTAANRFCIEAEEVAPPKSKFKV